MTEEKRLEAEIRNDEWQPARDKAALTAELQQAARNTLAKDRRMNIRIGSRDLAKLKARALEEGMPYQTLVASIIHRYLSGTLK